MRALYSSLSFREESLLSPRFDWWWHSGCIKKKKARFLGLFLVWVERFELSASWTPFKHATKLRYTQLWPYKDGESLLSLPVIASTTICIIAPLRICVNTQIQFFSKTFASKQKNNAKGNPWKWTVKEKMLSFGDGLWYNDLSAA